MHKDVKREARVIFMTFVRFFDLNYPNPALSIAKKEAIDYFKIKSLKNDLYLNQNYDKKYWSWKWLRMSSEHD